MLNKILISTLIAIITIFVTNVKAKSISNSHYNAWIPDKWIEFNDEIYNPFDSNQAKCIYFRNPKNKYQSLAVSLCLVDLAPEQILSHIGFTKIDGHIVRTGSMDFQAAHIEEKSGHIRVFASSTCGISDEVGFHAAGGDCYSEAIFGQDYSLTLETDGTEPMNLIKKISDSIILNTPGDPSFFIKKIKDARLDK
jgi:hypothetical protein